MMDIHVSRYIHGGAAMVLASFSLLAADAGNRVDLAALDLQSATVGHGKAEVKPKLTIGGQAFENGISAHAASLIPLELKGGATRFSASCGIDDDVQGKKGSVVFKVVGDGKTLWKSPLLQGGDAAVPVDVDVSGVQRLLLVATDGGDNNYFDHAVWVNGKIDLAPPRIVKAIPADFTATLPEIEPPKLGELTKPGAVTGIVKMADGVLFKTAAGQFKVTVVTPAILRLQATAAQEFAPPLDGYLVGKLPAKPEFTIEETAGQVVVKTPALRLAVDKGILAFSLVGADGRELLKTHGEGLRVGSKGLGYALEMGLRADEHIFGHGDLTGAPLDHRNAKNVGMKVEYRPRNIGTPFFMSTAGYGLFLNDDSQKLRYDYYGDEPDGRYTAVCEDRAFDCFLIGGSFKEIIAQYTGTLVGRAPLIPRYAFGTIWSLPSNCNDKTAIAVAERFRQEDLPTDSLQFEPGPGYKAYIPGDGQKTLGKLTELGYHTAVWNGRAPHFWKDHKQWLDWGLDWVKIDPYERDYSTNQTHDRDFATMTQDYNEIYPNRRHFISNCAGAGAAHRSPVQRLCDRSGRTPSYREMASAWMSAQPYVFIDQWATNAGGTAGGGLIYPGFPGDTSENCWSRETVPHPFFTPVVNGVNWSRTYCIGFPWDQKPDWLNAYRYYAKLRYALIPYYYSEAGACVHFTGVPMTRPLALEFQNDPKTYGLEAHSFMFGGSMLVAIAFEWMKGEREVYLPAGADWIDFWTGESFAGGQTVKLKIPATGAEHLCGLYVRAGAIIPMAPPMAWIGEEGNLPAPQKPLDTVILDLYPAATASDYAFYEDDGASNDYLKGKYSLTKIRCQGATAGATITVEPRQGDYQSARATWLMKVNVGFKPMVIAKAGGEELKPCATYEELQKADSGWFVGPAPLITGPEGFSLSARPGTVWIKVKDAGAGVDLVLKKTL